MIVKVLIRLNRINTKLTLDRRIRKDIRLVFIVQQIISDMLNDCRRLLVCDVCLASSTAYDVLARAEREFLVVLL